MSILGISQIFRKHPLIKTAAVYLAAAVSAILINKIYSLFGHGVSSVAMTYMFLYPLAGGAAAYLLLALLWPGLNRFAGFRMVYNLYNSGIAVLTVGSMLKGILEIAGTASPYIKFYYIAGYALAGAGLLLFGCFIINYRRVQTLKPDTK